MKFIATQTLGEIHMNGRERIRALLENKPVDRVGFWMGIPHEDARNIYLKHFNVKTGRAPFIKPSLF